MGNPYQTGFTPVTGARIVSGLIPGNSIADEILNDHPDRALRMCPSDAESMGVATGDTVRLITESGSASTVVEVSDMMQAGHVSLPNGMGVTYPTDDGNETVVGVPLTTLTSVTRRDKFFGTPWHKNVPVRIEPIQNSA